MKNKQTFLKRIVPFLILVMVLIFASGASVAQARSQNPRQDGAHEHSAAHNRNHEQEDTDRDGNHPDSGNANGDHHHDDSDTDDDTEGSDDDETPAHEPTAEIFSATLSPEAESTLPVLDEPDDNEDPDSEDNSDDNGQTTEDTLPEGVAMFKLVTRLVYDEETDSRIEVQELLYRLNVRNINDVTGAHIHVGQPGEDGDVVATLFAGETMGEFNGQLAEGMITESDLIGPLTGDMDGLVQLLESGGLYVNVHTTMNPAGEIRGQIAQ